MQERQRWFERQFNFDLPLTDFPNIIERLRGTPERLSEIVSSIPQTILTRRDNDSWSIQENVGHLGDLESLWLKRTQDFQSGKKQLTPADLENRFTHEANHNARSLSDLLAVFRAARLKHTSVLESLDHQAINNTAVHPRMGLAMRLVDHVFFVAEHDDHHLAIITSIIGRS
jgi:uncharacterized damage-inducible protein DinB